LPDQLTVADPGATLGPVGTGERLHIINELHRALDAFCGGATPADDVTVVAVETGTSEGVAPVRVERMFAADLARLAEVRAFTRAAVRGVPGLQVDPDRLARLELAVDEVASNIVRHAYQEQPGKSFSLVIKILPPEVEVVFGHSGLPLDPSRTAPPALDGKQEGGFGLYIIANTVDAVKYEDLPDRRHGVVLRARVGVGTGHD
jgi:anti-sigma regulatory factor (Ser/Thr protein kinase)